MTSKAECYVDYCIRPSISRGLCQMHYTRWKKWDDPYYNSRNTVEAKNLIKTLSVLPKGTDCVYWPFTKDADGYARQGNSRVCRIVCEAVNGPPPEPKFHAAHTCGNGMSGCVAWWHLVWKSAADNNLDKVLHGTSNKGETNPKDVLCEADVLVIRSSKKSVKELATHYKVHTTTIRFILKRKTWRHL